MNPENEARAVVEAWMTAEGIDFRRRAPAPGWSSRLVAFITATIVRLTKEVA